MEVVKYVAVMVTIPTTEDTRTDDFKTKSKVSDPTIAPCENRGSRGKSIRIVTVKKRGKRSIDKLLITRFVLSNPLSKFLTTTIMEAIAKAGIIPQRGKYTPINIKVGNNITKAN